MADDRRRIGATGERAVAVALERDGWLIVSRNARTRFGEIDLICVDGGALVFCEVKTLRGRSREVAFRALDSIGPRKRARIRRLARAWLGAGEGPRGYDAIRFDAFGVALGAGDRVIAIEHVRTAF